MPKRACIAGKSMVLEIQVHLIELWAFNMLGKSYTKLHPQLKKHLILKNRSRKDLGYARRAASTLYTARDARGV